MSAPTTYTRVFGHGPRALAWHLYLRLRRIVAPQRTTSPPPMLFQDKVIIMAIIPFWWINQFLVYRAHNGMLPWSQLLRRGALPVVLIRSGSFHIVVIVFMQLIGSGA